MKIGVLTCLTDETIDAGRLAVELEQRSFESVFLAEHTHIPVSRKTPFPDAYGGGELPDFYRRLADVFVTLGYMAAKTSSLGLGTGCCLVPQRDPIVTAKEVASLDRLSGGRFVFGVAYGWNEDEAGNHGVDFHRRFSVGREKLLAMKELWTKEVAAFDGEFVHVAPSWSWPKPQQRPYPSILFGGAGPKGMRHAIELADCWFPVPPADDPTLERSLATFRATAEEMGRDPDSIAVAVAAAPPDVRLLERYREQGVDRVALLLNAGGTDEVLRELEALTEVVRSLS